MIPTKREGNKMFMDLPIFWAVLFLVPGTVLLMKAIVDLEMPTYDGYTITVYLFIGMLTIFGISILMRRFRYGR